MMSVGLVVAAGFTSSMLLVRLTGFRRVTEGYGCKLRKGLFGVGLVSGVVDTFRTCFFFFFFLLLCVIHRFVSPIDCWYLVAVLCCRLAYLMALRDWCLVALYRLTELLDDIYLLVVVVAGRLRYQLSVGVVSDADACCVGYGRLLWALLAGVLYCTGCIILCIGFDGVSCCCVSDLDVAAITLQLCLLLMVAVTGYRLSDTTNINLELL